MQVKDLLKILEKQNKNLYVYFIDKYADKEYTSDLRNVTIKKDRIILDNNNNVVF